MLLNKFAALAVCCCLASAAIAQESVDTQATKVASKAPATAVATAKTDAPTSVKVMLNKEGTLEGKAFLTDSKAVAPNAKISLTADGKVVDAVETDKNGIFAFANVAPGAYQLLGTADSYVGSQSFDVSSYASPAVGGCSTCSLGMSSAPAEVVYDSYSSAPVSSFASSCGACNSSCGTCGSGFGGGGGRFGGRLGGGLLSNGRIGLVGLAGLAGLAGIDSSPDQ